MINRFLNDPRYYKDVNTEVVCPFKFNSNVLIHQDNIIPIKSISRLTRSSSYIQIWLNDDHSEYMDFNDNVHNLKRCYSKLENYVANSN